MKKFAYLFIVLLTAVILAAVPSLAEEAAAFSFRNGITFGMTEEELMQAEAEKNGVSDEDWNSMELVSWHAVGPAGGAQFAGCPVNLIYFLADGRMEAAGYDFLSGSAEDYDAAAALLSEEYGEATPVSPEDAAALMDCFSPGFYSADDLFSVQAWQQDNVVVYQFYYQEGSFVVMFTDPAFDYASVNQAAAEDDAA